jgi:hypothetical protein
VKTSIHRTGLVLLVAALLFTKASFAQPTGKVVINEYMPWTSNTCGVPSEFVELLNFGPGPVNIGCYILTTGVYSVTIPSNTILYPGQFYVLAGESFIPGNCDNVDSSATGIHANLNWNTCNCTNKPIPSANNTSGMMNDDGSSPLVLLDPSLNVVDAVVRSLPGAATGPVTSSSVGGKCTSQTFNIGTMSINYETLGMAPGNQNSYARTLDGDCNWLKQPQESGNATNNRSGNTTDISYEFDMVNPTSCDESGLGSVSIYVKHSNYAAVFPMGYTIATDVNNDGQFDFTDQYTSAVDNSPPFIEIDNLPVGHFKVTVYSIKGCYLKNFEFTIIPCNPSTLPVKLVYFKNKGLSEGRHQLEWLLQDVQNLQSVVLEKSESGEKFVPEKIVTNSGDRGDKVYAAPVAAGATFRYYRLKITQKSGKMFYSPVINTLNETQTANRVWPNPATDKLNVELSNLEKQTPAYCIYNTSGLVVARGVLPANGNEKVSTISLPASLKPGVYQLQIDAASGTGQPISFRFVKH